MRRELLYRPDLLTQRITESCVRMYRRWSLRGTVAAGLGDGYLDSFELVRIVAERGTPRVIYDVGAAYGTWTIMARACCPDAQIHAFEPIEQQYVAFRERTRGLDRVSLHPVALGAQRGVVPMHVHRFADASSMLPLSDAEACRWPGHELELREVPLWPLDDYIREHALAPPDLLKMDVQGFELEVLRGSTAALRSARWVIAEVSFKELYQGQPLFGRLACFLEEAGFQLLALAQNTPVGAPLKPQTDALFVARDAP